MEEQKSSLSHSDVFMIIHGWGLCAYHFINVQLLLTGTPLWSFVLPFEFHVFCVYKEHSCILLVSELLLALYQIKTIILA